MVIWPFGKSKQQKQLDAMSSRLTAISRSMGISERMIYPDYKSFDNAERYSTMDDIYAIVNLISNTVASIPFYNYIKNNDGKLTDAPEDNDLSLILEKGYEGMNCFESRYITAASLCIQGETIAWKFKPTIGPNKGKVRGIYFMEPQNVQIKVEQTGFPRKIICYQYIENGTVIIDNIPPDEIIHIKYPTMQVSVNGENFRGLSPLKVLNKRMNRVDRSMDVSVSQLKNGGVPGVLYEKGHADDLTDVLSKRKEKMYKFFSEKSNKGMPYIAGGEMDYIELGLKLADMSVADLEKIDHKKLCNVYSVSDRLFNNDATGSEISDKNARVGLYVNAAVPILNRIKDAYNSSLASEFTDKKYVIKYDISEVPELQKNIKEMADAFASLPMFIPTQILDAFKLEAPDGVDKSLLEKIYVKQGYVPIEDMGAVDLLPNTGDYGQPDNQ